MDDRRDYIDQLQLPNKDKKIIDKVNKKNRNGYTLTLFDKLLISGIIVLLILALFIRS